MANAKHRAAKRPRGRPVGSEVECRTKGTEVIWPKGLEERYGISKTTRWLWEQQGKLPPRDFHVGNKPEGWYLSTIEAAERGELRVPFERGGKARAAAA